MTYISPFSAQPRRKFFRILLRVAARQDVSRDLFADPQQNYREAVQFYQHDIDWTNRLILGDKLQVICSTANIVRQLKSRLTHLALSPGHVSPATMWSAAVPGIPQRAGTGQRQ